MKAQRVGLIVVLVGLLLVMAAQGAGAACGSWGTVTNVTPYPYWGGGYWVAVHLDSGAWTSFQSTRRFVVGGRTWVWGCADATRYVEGAWAW